MKRGFSVTGICFTQPELATALLKIRADLVIVLCSGYSAQVSEDNVKGIGIREYCMKPLTMTQLAMVARRVLDESGKPSTAKR